MGSMMLIEKGRRARPICRECGALHGERECPRRLPEDYPTTAEWKVITRECRETYREMMADQKRHEELRRKSS